METKEERLAIMRWETETGPTAGKNKRPSGDKKNLKDKVIVKKPGSGVGMTSGPMKRTLETQITSIATDKAGDQGKKVPSQPLTGSIKTITKVSPSSNGAIAAARQKLPMPAVKQHPAGSGKPPRSFRKKPS